MANEAKQFTIGGVTHDVMDVGARQAIASLQNAIDAITSGDTTTAIKTFQEVIDFLDGVTDDATLIGKLNELRTLIAAKYSKPASGIPASDLANGAIPDVSGFATKTEVNAKANSADVYSKSEVDDKVADAGKVKSVTINGSKKLPNEQTGDVDIGTVVGTQGPKGDTGNVNITDADELVAILVNDLTTGGAGNILSAEMGRRLAMMSGTYAQAWARSKAIPFPFCFLWVETVDGNAISKPIWHKGNSVFVDAAGSFINVDAAAVPAAPTITGATSGAEVPKNTQITITPDACSALYYSLDGGTTYNISDAAVTVALTNAGSVSIVAYCANNKGNSSNATLNITVAGTPVPVFSPSQGEVARGGYVTISVPSGGELQYKVGSGSWQTASGTSASVQITGNTTIQAYNIQDGDTSDTVSADFFMEALAAPTFSKDAGELVEGTEVAINMPSGATKVYYNITTDNTEPADPTASSTEYSGVIMINSATRIKAVAEDAYGLGLVASVSYTIREDALIIDTTNATGSVTINGTAYALDSSTPPPNGTGYRNTIPYSQMTNVVNKAITSITFSAPASIKRIYGGGGKITFNQNTFASAATALTLIEADVTGSGSNYVFKNIGSNWGSVTLRLSGTMQGFGNQAFVGTGNLDLTLDISRLVPPSGGFICSDAFRSVASTVLIISETFAISASNPASNTDSIFSYAKMTTLIIVSSTPPDLTSVNWLNGILAKKTDSDKLNIRVPVGSLETYQNADSSISKGWGAYAENEKITWSTF